MKRLLHALALVILGLTILGCSNGADPSVPVTDPVQPPELSVAVSGQSQVHLWGLYEITVDTDSMTVEVIPNRGAMFTANVVNFINSSQDGLGFTINEVIPGVDYTDIDLDVMISHPFPGLPQYNGYDVRGIFMGDGSTSLAYNTDYSYAEHGFEQFMLSDPDDGYGGPDGYTRWFNQEEFSYGGMPLFQYTQGKYATPDYSPTATLNPYKYFADGLNETENLFDWLVVDGEDFGVFTSGATNSRNYYLRFPDSTGIQFSYAITANWIDGDTHPANAHEAVAVDVTDTSDLYYSDPLNYGGSMILDVSVWDWDSKISNGVMEDYNVIIESDVLDSPYTLQPSEMTPAGGTDQYSTYHVEIPADTISGPDGKEYWVIIEQTGYDYSNPYDVPNDAEDNVLAAFFRYDLEIGDEIPATLTLLTPNGGEEWVPGTEEEITWTYEGLTGTVELEYSKDGFVSDFEVIDTGIDVTFGSYIWEIPCDISDTLRVRISSTGMPSIFDISDDDFSIVTSGWAHNYKDPYYEEGRRVDFDSDGNIYMAGTYRPSPGDRNHGFVAKYNPCGELLWDQHWGGTGHTQGYGVAVDSDGNSYITGNFYGTTNFDPDDIGGPNQITSTGGGSWDVWIVKFDTNGDFVWVRTFGGTYSDTGRGIAVDSSDNVYCSGHYSLTVDFDPAGGDSRTSNGDFDCFITKFDSSGTHQWVKTWGGSGEDRGRDCAAGGGNVYATGFFHGTGVNFNEDDMWPLNSNGGEDVYLVGFDESGTFQWAYNWGGTQTGLSTDNGQGVTVDSDGDVYCAGFFRGSNVDFDPSYGFDIHDSNGACDSFVAHYTSAGLFITAETFGGTSNDEATGVAVDNSGNVYLSGHYWGTMDLDPDGGEQHVAQFIDGYLSKLDSTGDFVWGRVWGGSNVDRGFGVGCFGDEYVCATGFFNGTDIEFAPTGPPCNNESNPLTASGNADAFIVKYFPNGCW